MPHLLGRDTAKHENRAGRGSTWNSIFGLNLKHKVMGCQPFPGYVPVRIIAVTAYRFLPLLDSRQTGRYFKFYLCSIILFSLF
jgi:hypothetical protein